MVAWLDSHHPQYASRKIVGGTKGCITKPPEQRHHDSGSKGQGVTVSATDMSFTVLFFECLPAGTEPDMIQLQFYGQDHPDTVHIYMHTSHKGQAWVIFASETTPGVPNH
jgi:hypothetical protein